MAFQPSVEQQAIFDAFLMGEANNLAVEALAGTGKTTTLVELARKLPPKGSKIFCAFNKSIVDELSARLQGTGMWAKTFHSIGVAALKKHLGATDVKLEGGKYREIVKAWLTDEPGVIDANDDEARDRTIKRRETQTELALAIAEAASHITDQADREKYVRELFKETVKMAVELLNFMRLRLVDWYNGEALYELVHQYRMADEINDEWSLVDIVIGAVPDMMNDAERQTKQHRIDYTDMIYWPVRWNVRFYQYEIVFVDECQDLSPLQREMVKRIVYTRGGRIVLVGDPNQAIYAFAGADSDSFDLSVEQFKAKVLPLTVTRRCSAIITQHAAELVPPFRCLPDKARGKVVWLDENRLLAQAQPGDFILSRTKAPMVAKCLELLAAGRPATILGSDIGKQLIGLLEKVQNRKDYTWEKLPDVLTAYEGEQVEKYMAKGDEVMAEAIKDMCSALAIIIESAKATDSDALVYYIEGLFSESKMEHKIVFSTVHKAKGLESERVFILKPEKLPLLYANLTPEARRQEYNLYYVAVTRAKSTLVYLTNPDYLKDRTKPPYVQTDFNEHDWSQVVVSVPELPSGIINSNSWVVGEDANFDELDDDEASAFAGLMTGQAGKKLAELIAMTEDMEKAAPVEPEHVEPDGTSEWMIENQRRVPYGADWLFWKPCRECGVIGHTQKNKCYDCSVCTCEAMLDDDGKCPDCDRPVSQPAPAPTAPVFQASGDIKRDLVLYRTVQTQQIERLTAWAKAVDVNKLAELIDILSDMAGVQA
jgi:superfamily I DNA/RNA helicase